MFGLGRIAALDDLPRMARPIRAIAKLRLARRRLGGWREVARRAYQYLAAEGPARTLARIRSYGGPASSVDATGIIRRRYADLRADITDRIGPRPPVPPGSDDVADGPLISLILPVYRVPVSLLEQAIGSVLRQSYPRWELCIVDDASGDARIADRLRRYAATDERIKLLLSETNGGISAASNQAIAMASGDYIGFLDHDDMLTHDALHWVARAVVDQPDIDVLYSDECKIDDSNRVHEIFCKPGWSPALMFNCMYIGHLTLYRAPLIDAVGGLRSQYDFSQDYDLALRITEQRVKVEHIDRVLYCWRMTAGSAAAGDKPYARQTNIAALQDALNRRGYPAEAVALPTANYAKWHRDGLKNKVSIVIPSDHVEHITDSVTSIESGTGYRDYEIIVVTKSTIAQALAATVGSRVRFVAYDQPFNFSDKCNAGAAQAQGEYLVFFNDDVRVVTEDWIEALLECLQIDGVGAVAPKLLYEDGTIQHAGLVSGVRRLFGTAFHAQPADTTTYFNFAQSLREASSVSAACLAMPMTLFRALRGFDTINTPIGHSDIDLCFRLSDFGYRSVYTPHATLLHKGHQSLASYAPDEGRETEGGEIPAEATRRAKDKADIHVLRQWPDLVAHDPYFPATMRDLVYTDSPEDFALYPGRARRDGGGLDILILAHDLTNSGAPRVLYDMVRVLHAAGHFVVVMAAEAGYFRELLSDLGVNVIIEPLLLQRHESVLDFARNFDRIIANTIIMLPAVLQLARVADVYWYIHESKLIADQYESRGDFVQALYEAKEIWTVSQRALRFLRKRRTDVQVVETSVAVASAAASDSRRPHQQGGPIVFAVIGSYEPRKGQDLAIDAIKLLPDAMRRRCRFDFVGRVLDRGFHRAIAARARGQMGIELGPELPYDECMDVMRHADVVFCPSRDDSFSLVAMEALASGKVLLCTRATGVSDYIRHGESGFVIEGEHHPDPICAGILECVESEAEWPRIAAAGQEVHRRLFTFDAFAQRIRQRLDA